MPFIKITPSLPVYYETSGNGLPIVFIHPPHMSHQVFKYQRELSVYYQIITYDIRGHGNSGKDDGSMTISKLSNDLALFLDRLEINKAIIVGYSAGGTIAQAFTLHYPNKVEALVLSGGFPEVNTLALRIQYHIGLKLLQNGRRKLLSKHLAKSHKVSQEDQPLLFRECLKADSKMAFDYYVNSMQYNCTAFLKNIECPVLMLYGQLSHIRPYLSLYTQHLPQMKSILVDKALHQLPIKNYPSFNQALSTFIEDI